MAQVESSEYTSKSDVVDDLIRKGRAVELEAEKIRAKLIEAEQSGLVTPDRRAILAEIKARKKPMKIAGYKLAQAASDDLQLTYAYGFEL